MLDIIICDGNKNYMQDNVTAINKAMINYDFSFHIFKFANLNDELLTIIKDDSSRKIFIMNIDLGMEIAKLIRKYNFNSLIIFTSNTHCDCMNIFDNKLMVFDIVYRDCAYMTRLIDDIKMATDMIFRNNVLIFKYNSVIYRLPYEYINYIEKEQMVKRCLIHTTKGNFYIVSSIEKILEMLDNNFVRTHKSCIVNLNNIREIDLSVNKVVFMNDEYTLLLTNKMKRVIKGNLCNNK